MQLQEISLFMSSNDMSKTAKGTKVRDTTFDSFMTNHASKVSSDKSIQKDTKVENPKSNCVSVNEGAVANKMRKSKDMISSEKCDKSAVEENVDVAEMVAQTMVVLQNIFGLSEEELTDVMEQLGIQIQDLLFQFQQDTVIPVNVNAIQEFVLGLHGVEDSAVILTNDLLNQEIGQVIEELTNILAEGFEINPEELSSLQKELKPDFVEQLQQIESSLNESVNEENATTTEDDITDTSIAGGEKMPVFVEKDMTSGQENDSDFAQSESPGIMEHSNHETHIGEQVASNFTERMSEALEHVSNAEELTAERTTTQIVEQVVRQVRIRVMPETTSMELQLNPASLGRVNLTVATTGGVATATMVVENQMAKSALESQMITLKETFAEQGLKVEEVEVTVAEFGLKKENQQQQENAQGKKSNRRFRGDDELPEDDVDLDTNATASERRDVNSVVDYTA